MRNERYADISTIELPSSWNQIIFVDFRDIDEGLYLSEKHELTQLYNFEIYDKMRLGLGNIKLADLIDPTHSFCYIACCIFLHIHEWDELIDKKGEIVKYAFNILKLDNIKIIDSEDQVLVASPYNLEVTESLDDYFPIDDSFEVKLLK